MKILLTLMSLEIGGAETHVLALAKELHKKRHIPVVISAGGIYVKELEENGIKHYRLPLSSKRPLDLLISVKKMVDIINKENIEIVHAHGRIPSLVSKMATMIKRKPFITTVHAVYKVNSYKFFSCFGEKTICISEDTKKHIIDNYNVDESRITIIPNGINLLKFNENVNIKNLDVYEDDSDVVKISYISRMEGELANRAVRVGKLLSEYACKNNLKIKYLIIGDGKDFNYVVSQIDKDMKKEKNVKVKILGKRTDIPELINYSDFVVCVSRSALEAMACSTPVVLLGGEGYEGLLTEENFKIAQRSNFTGRDSNKIFTDDKFLKDIEYLIGEKSDGNIKEIGKYLKNKIIDEYSVGKIVDDTLDLYIEVIGGKQS